MATTARVIPQLPFSFRARRWARANLFSNGANTVLTVVTALVVAYVTYQVLRFVFVTADWRVVVENRRLITVGRMPPGEEWRLWPPIWAFVALAGFSTGLWSRVGLRGALGIALAVGLLFVFLVHGENAVRLGAGLVIAAALYFAGRRLAAREESPATARARRAAAIGWALLVPFLVTMLLISGGIRTSLWGGFLLNVLLAAVGIEAAIPLGILLALGRTSTLPAIRIVCSVYIEVIRGAPLIAWLFVAWFVLPGFLPPVFDLNKMDLVLRAMLMLSIFTSAYIAEIVRGGLQSIPRGQYEAAQALGLGTFTITTDIVLPQALRAVIPALVSQLISLWKDTSLVSILALTEGLGASQAAVSQREFFGRQREVLLFAAAVFWVVAYAMSRFSLRLEHRLGVGRR